MLKSFAVRAIIFDLDGTLVDSAEHLRTALNVMLNELDLRSIASDEIKAMIGDGVASLVERALIAANGDSAQAAALLPRFLEIYQANPATLTRCYPGVVETLETLRLGKCRMAVVTNKPVNATKAILKALFLEEFFAVVVGGDSLKERKPHPGPLLEAARQLGLNADQLLMVGDNIHDIEAARAAGMGCIGVSYGYHHRPPYEFDADLLIDRFDDLLAAVNLELRRCNTRRDAERISPIHPFAL